LLTIKRTISDLQEQRVSGTITDLPQKSERVGGFKQKPRGGRKRLEKDVDAVVSPK